jgi:hypothetical protein
MFKFVPLGEKPEFISDGNVFYVMNTITNKKLGIIVEITPITVYVISTDNTEFESVEFASREEAARYLQQTRK